MFKTKDGYFEYSNRTVTLFFLESEEDKFLAAFRSGSIVNLCNVACLELNKYGVFEKSRWHHVHCEFALRAQCKRMGFGDDVYMSLSKAEIAESDAAHKKQLLEKFWTRCKQCGTINN